MFVVTKKFGRNETRLSEFTKAHDAIAFIQEKLKEDKRFKLNTSYCLYEGADLIREYTQIDIIEEGQEASSDSSSQQKSSSQSFRPNPFTTAPRIGPQSYIKDTGNEEDEEK